MISWKTLKKIIGVIHACVTENQNWWLYDRCEDRWPSIFSGTSYRGDNIPTAISTSVQMSIKRWRLIFISKVESLKISMHNNYYECILIRVSCPYTNGEDCEPVCTWLCTINDSVFDLSFHDWSWRKLGSCASGV